ncbi:MAG: sensor domain-containing diguanylate cyclase [Treponema sp.]|jgi:diguanylate cyclase (GGDEF)-like protein|nr:sensor domain-containing diguanylate cyclase [Treponema sp.]
MKKAHKQELPPAPDDAGTVEELTAESSDNSQLLLEDFYSDPKILENFTLLQEIGVFRQMDNLTKKIHNYRDLFSGGLDIINRTSIDAIMDAAVFRISDHFLPSFIAFLWKPIQNREEITIKGYQNYKPVDLGIKLHNIAPFEPFFESHPQPVGFPLLAAELGDKNALKAMEKLNPEIVIPILGGFGLYGIILMGHKMLGNDFTNEEILFIEQLMAFVSQAIKNYLHYEHSLRDVKTGLYNHSFFLHRLNEEIARTRRNKYVSSMIVMDVDKFKNFNDAFGHLAGDKVLETLAITIKQTVRTDDVPSRFGGEEFTVLLPNSNEEAAFVVAERLRSAIAEMKVPWNPALPQVTISLGICSFDHQEQLTADGIILRADAALYVSKGQGRNCSTAWTPGIEHGAGKETL